jgi:two-component system sensor histidine kinase CpxA
MAVRLEGYVAGQKRFLGDTAHELLSPLARLEVAISILEQRTAPEDRGYTERALGEVSHISALVHELLAFSKTTLKAGDTKLEELPLSVVVRECAAREGSLPDIEIPDALCVVASRALLGRAVGNIIRNAIRYAPGPLRISATRHGERVEVSFADEGPGVPADALPKIFDPFFRPDTSRNSETGGVGLGLAIVKTCVEACAGTVVANNREPRGFVVTLSLRTGSA